MSESCLFVKNVNLYNKLQLKQTLFRCLSMFVITGVYCTGVQIEVKASDQKQILTLLQPWLPASQHLQTPFWSFSQVLFPGQWLNSHWMGISISYRVYKSPVNYCHWVVNCLTDVFLSSQNEWNIVQLKFLLAVFYCHPTIVIYEFVMVTQTICCIICTKQIISLHSN